MVFTYPEGLSYALNSAQESNVESSKNNMSNNEADSYRLHRRLVRLGQFLLLLGALVLVSHWLAHIGIFGTSQPPGWAELFVGYPMGALLLIAGAILAGRRQT